MPRGIFWPGTGKARSIAAKSSLVIFQPTPPLFSLTRSGRLAFGIVKIPGWRIRKLSTTCLEVRLYRSAIQASTRPPALCGDGKLPCPNGAYPTTAIPLWVQYGSRRRSIPRSPRWYNTWSHVIRSFLSARSASFSSSTSKLLTPMNELDLWSPASPWHALSHWCN